MLKQQKFVAGFTLMEILIALLVVSVGLLGVATLQVRGQQFNQAAYLRTQAAFLAHDIMERMRINTDRTGNGIAGNADDGGYANNSMGDAAGCPAMGTDCDSGTCSLAQLATYDLAQWCGRLQEWLPAAEARIDWNGTSYDIFICWSNILDGTNGNCEIPDSEQKEGQRWSFQPQ